LQQRLLKKEWDLESITRVFKKQISIIFGTNMAQYVIRKMLGINKFGLTISLLTLILALFIFPIFISMFYINEYARVEITHLLKSESCEATYTHRNANPLNPLEFYLNHRYWLSDYRLPDVYLENKDYSNCLNRVLNKIIALKNSGNSLCIAFVNSYGKVSARLCLN